VLAQLVADGKRERKLEFEAGANRDKITRLNSSVAAVRQPTAGDIDVVAAARAGWSRSTS
jgi:hypothetical protein